MRKERPSGDPRSDRPSEAAPSTASHDPGCAYFERLEEVERRHWWCRSVRRVALARLRRIPGERPVILDVGCGAGGFLSHVRRARPAARCVGADFSGEAVAFARTNLAGSLLRASAADLPLASDWADAVVLHDVLQHLPRGDDARALAEARRVLRPGGVLSLRSNIGARVETESASLHRRYDPAALARLVRDSGFEVEKHIVLHPLAALLGRLRNRRAAPRGHSQDLEGGKGLAVNLPGPLINEAMDLYSRIEDAAITRLPNPIALGDSQLIFARKPLAGTAR
ncbi:MAG: class I SAM-dependent methyltransferase [Acidobacteria bacterium]|nr:class I SAM-dependent methyltransferase [Acidobacteriota bacterium]MCA1610981.1 class I SAM-dependent methyltransferase [Acidobacteriota bacterium]